MLRIAICDDAGEDRQTVLACVKVFLNTKKLEAEFELFSNAEDLLLMKQQFDLYLLDVMMPGITGMEAAAELSKGGKKPVIIFITSSLESAVDGYRVNAAGFILKPIQKDEVADTLSRVMAQYLKSESSISIIHNRIPISLSFCKILYFENRLHRVYVMLTDGEIVTTHQKLSELQEKLTPFPQFLRCHQSYIVNLDQVKQMDMTSFQMKHQQIIPVSRNFYKQSKNAYYHHLLK